MIPGFPEACVLRGILSLGKGSPPRPVGTTRDHLGRGGGFGAYWGLPGSTRPD